MTRDNSSKPAKPSSDFPLFPHATKRWAKKIRGRLVYFGPWEDPDGALRKYLDQKEELHHGKRPEPEALTVFRMCAKFLTTKKQKLTVGELAPHSFRFYGATCKRLIKHLGKNTLVDNLRPEDFEKMMRAYEGWGPLTVSNEINRVHVVFNYVYKNRLIDRPMLYGEGFRRPSRKTVRKHRAEKGPQMFEAAEIHAMLKAAVQPLKAMVLLGVNCGYGNADVGTLPLSALNLDAGWIRYHRPKTGIDRRCPLWPETLDALREWLAIRPQPRQEQDAGLVFLTSAGLSWAKTTTATPLSKAMRRLLDGLGINGHRNFYGLRHTFQTVSDEARDFVATRHIMGHVGADIADTYRDRITDERLRDVVAHVHGWLFGKPATKRKPKTKPALRIVSA